MTHMKAFTEVRPLHGRSLCGYDNMDLTTNIQLCTCPQCRSIYDDVTLYFDQKDDDNLKVGLQFDIGI